MKIRLLLVGALLTLSATAAQAQGPYVTAGGGVSIFHDSDYEITGLGTATMSYDSGLAFNLAAGYDFGSIRAEAEYGYRNADVDKFSGSGGSFSVSGVDATVSSYMFNGYVDLNPESTVKPFFGVGLGMLKGTFDDNGDKVDDTVPGYQLIAGVSIAATKQVAFDLSYRFQGATSDFEKDGTKISYMNSSLWLASGLVSSSKQLRYRLPVAELPLICLPIRQGNAETLPFGINGIFITEQPSMHHHFTTFN